MNRQRRCRNPNDADRIANKANENHHPNHNTIDDVRQIPEAEFRQQMHDWMQSTEVSQRLQSKLRMDLFEAFNATSLGRQMTDRHHRQQQQQQVKTSNTGTILATNTPLLLALNTMVSEFLYTQNCHFTLSVLASETPHRNTMPDFESESGRFRFSRRHVQQLLDSMRWLTAGGHQTADAMRRNEAICQAYLNPSVDEEIVNDSLLFAVCQKSMIGQSIGSTQLADNWTQTECCKSKSAHGKRTSRRAERADNSAASLSSSSSSRSRNRNFHRPIRSHLKRITAHVLRMTENLMQFSSTMHISSLAQLSNLKMPTPSSHHQRNAKLKRNIQNLTGALNRLTMRLETCLSDVIRTHRRTPTPPDAAAAKPSPAEDNDGGGYSAWVLQLKQSRHGRHFIDNLRSHYRNVWLRETERQRTEWELKFQQEQRLLKLHYKQRLLERYRDLLASTSKEMTASNRQVDEVQEARARQVVVDVGMMTDVSDSDDRGERQKYGKRQSNRKGLSNRKLPDIDISPDSTKQPPILQQRQNKPTSTSQQLCPETHKPNDSVVDEAPTRTRIRQLEAASTAIERTVQQRLQEHNVEREKIATQQKLIQQQRFVGKQLMDGRKAKSMELHRQSMALLVGSGDGAPKVPIDCDAMCKQDYEND